MLVDSKSFLAFWIYETNNNNPGYPRIDSGGQDCSPEEKKDTPGKTPT